MASANRQNRFPATHSGVAQSPCAGRSVQRGPQWGTGTPPEEHTIRIAFVINSIAGGGAERVLEMLLRPQFRRGHETVLVTLDDLPDARVMPDVARLRLNTDGGLLRSVRLLRPALDRVAPDVVVSLLIRSNLANVLASVGRPWRSVLCERMHLGSHLANQARGARLAAMRLLPRLCYRHADAILAVSQGVADDLAANFAVPADRLGVIGNPYDLAAIADAVRAPAGIPLPARFAVAAGRLVEAKNMAMVIRSFGEAAIAGDLVILGDGPQRAMLLDLAQQTGLAGRVHLPGYLANPHAVMARASAYLSASRNEGFPNAMAEAMALGLPVIATDCPSGPAELLAGGQAGMLVAMEDQAGMAQHLRDLTPAVARSFGQAARARIAGYAMERVVPQYWDCFTAGGDGPDPGTAGHVH